MCVCVSLVSSVLFARIIFLGILCICRFCLLLSNDFHFNCFCISCVCSLGFSHFNYSLNRAHRFLPYYLCGFLTRFFFLNFCYCYVAGCIFVFFFGLLKMIAGTLHIYLGYDEHDDICNHHHWCVCTGCWSTPTSCIYTNVTLHQKWVVNNMDYAISTLHIWPKYGNVSIAPLDRITCYATNRHRENK